MDDVRCFTVCSLDAVVVVERQLLVEFLFTFLNNNDESPDLTSKEWSCLLFPLNMLTQSELFLNVEIDVTIPNTLKFKTILEVNLYII